MDPSKDAIRNAALELGFSRIGFARAEPIPGGPLTEWLYRGYQGSMAYMARNPDVRLDPGLLLPGCRTVISLSLNYYTPYPTRAHRGHGRVSRYAWGRDYHKVMRKKLKALARKISDILPGSKTKSCVDTSPVMEKIWAQRAGVGWQGKNGNVISRELGSWFFLGEILTDAVIEPDAPYADFCGTCNRCVEACPTQAIVEPYVVDGSRCISYLTIEAKEPAAGELAEKSGDWIFGCDICQEVCPWNKFSATTSEEDFFPRLENQRPLESWREMEEDEFRAQFSGTPLMRPKRKRMAENARIAMENSQKEIPVLPKKSLQHEAENLHP